MGNLQYIYIYIFFKRTDPSAFIDESWMTVTLESGPEVDHVSFRADWCLHRAFVRRPGHHLLDQGEVSHGAVKVRSTGLGWTIPEMPRLFKLI